MKNYVLQKAQSRRGAKPKYRIYHGGDVILGKARYIDDALKTFEEVTGLSRSIVQHAYEVNEVRLTQINRGNFGEITRFFNDHDLIKKFHEIVDDWFEFFGHTPADLKQSCEIHLSLVKRLPRNASGTAYTGSIPVGSGFSRIKLGANCQTTKITGWFPTIAQKVDAMVGVFAHEICHIMDACVGRKVKAVRLKRGEMYHSYFLKSVAEFRAEQFAARWSESSRENFKNVLEYAIENNVGIPNDWYTTPKE